MRRREERGEGGVRVDLGYICVPLTTKIAIVNDSALAE